MRLLLALSLIAASPAASPANPQIDYAGFASLTNRVAPDRARRLLSFGDFKRKAARKDALILDARSKDAFAEGHIVGAVNLPLTDFTAESLAAVIGDNTNRPILIYCNNNFRNHTRPVPLKAAPLALNIQTFINLYGYGYRNVFELGEAVRTDAREVRWVAGASS